MTIKINGTNTAANPSITGTDTDTGIVYGSDQIDFSLGGSSKVFLNSSGNQLFTGNAVIGVNSNSSNLYLGGGSNQPSEAYLESGTLSAFKVGGSEAARIDSNLNVGLGTTTPTEKLSIYKYRSYNSDAALYQTIGTNSDAVDNNKIHQWRFGITGNASSGSSLAFSTLPSTQSTYIEEVRFQSTGGISFNGDTAAANAISDYEEGYWSPAGLDGMNITIQNTSNNPSRRYIKIGKQVFAYFDFTFQNLFNTHTARFGGLPYAQASGGHQGSAAVAVGFTTKSADVYIHISGLYPTLFKNSGTAYNYNEVSSNRMAGVIIYTTD